MHELEIIRLFGNLIAGKIAYQNNPINIKRIKNISFLKRKEPKAIIIAEINRGLSLKFTMIEEIFMLI
jgi:hypothetical protein